MGLNRWLVAGMGAFVLTGTLVTVRAGELAAPGQTAIAATNVIHQTTCPVMKGNEINKKVFVDYEGKRIYMCCPMCLKTVKSDPAKYVKLLEGQGITLDKAEARKAAEGSK